MLPQVATVDLTQWKGDFQAPVFFFEGTQDPYCRPLLVQQYYENDEGSAEGAGLV